MELISSIVGILSGLIAIYTFTTGVNSLAQLRQAGQRPESALPRPVTKLRPEIGRLLILIPLFGASIAVTATMGLSGSDTGGIFCLLLVVAAVAVFAFNWFGLSNVVPLRIFGPATAGGIAALGLLFGVVSRGEEAFGFGSGVAIGIGAWIILALTSQFPGLTHPQAKSDRRTGDRPDAAVVQSKEEKVVLRIASKRLGRVRVTDVALESEINLDRATQILESLAQRGYCEKCEEESGVVAYRFPDFEKG